MGLGKFDDFVAYLIRKADATLAKIKDNSILAQMMTIDGDISNFDDNLHSLQAISEAIASLAGGAFFGSYGPKNVEVDNDVDFGIMLYDPSGNVIATGEITQGTYTVRRIRVATDTEIISATASSEAAGRVYMTYAFPSASWNVGDIFYITFSGIITTLDGITTEYPNLFVWGRVTREADISSKIDIVDGYHDVPTKDAATDAQMRDVVGKKDDTASETAVDTDSLISYLKGALVILGERNTAAATGAVGTTKDVIAYIKQLVTLLLDGTYGLSALETLVDDIETRIGVSTDDADLATLFAKHKQVFLGAHVHVLLIVNNASSLNADTDTALKDELEDQGYDVVVADPADIAGNLELSFDFIVVSGSITADANLTLLREADCPVITHSAEVAVSTNIFSLGATAGIQAAQTQIEIVDNTVEWVIGKALGNLTVTASAELETMVSVSGATISVAEEDTGTGNKITMAVLRQGTEDGSGVVHPFDRYFIGIKDFTLADSTMKAIMADLWHHVVFELRFGEVTATVKRGFEEQIPDTGFTLASVDTSLGTDPPSADAVNSMVDIDKKPNRTFVLRSLFANVTGLGGGSNTMTLQLWIDIGGTPTSVDSKDITATGYYNLVDIFGLNEVHADSIHVTAIVNSGTGAISGVYRFAEARK